MTNTPSYYSNNKEYLCKYRSQWESKYIEKIGREQWLEERRKKRLNNPVGYLLANAKIRAKKKNLEFNLEKEDIQIPDFCPILGIPIKFGVMKECKDDSPSIDRFDSTQGYVKGNVNIISWRANNLKSNGTLKEFRRLVEWLEQKNGT